MTAGTALELACHCGAVRLQLARQPDFVNECNCSLCAKAGVWWAYCDPAEVTVSGETHGYRRSDKPDPGAEIRFCPTCGVTTHFILTESAVARFGNTMMGANVRLADEADLSGAELR